MKYFKTYSEFINENEDETRVSLIAVGDMLAHNAIHDDCKTANGFDYTPLFTTLKNSIAGYDLKYCNAERQFQIQAYTGAK